MYRNFTAKGLIGAAGRWPCGLPYDQRRTADILLTKA